LTCKRADAILFANIRKNKDLHMACGERLAKEMRTRGYRVTAQRTIILETIAHMNGHLSAQQVYERAVERLPGLNLATVYRAVETLHEAGLVDMLEAQSEPMRFALRDPENPHGHLVCTYCGCVMDLDAGLIQSLADAVATQTNFHIDHHHLTLQGTCPDCEKKMGAN
jgi:Fur family ferric uptake transcriptional regulator